MNRREFFIAEKYKKEGWQPLKNGAPDFIMLKTKDNQILEMIAVEVKSLSDNLSFEQGIWKMICEKAKIPYKVEQVK